MSANLTILIVDDEKDICKLLGWDFESAGFNIFQAHGGRDAMLLLKNEKIDVVLSDIKMPEGDGIELLNEVKKNNIPLKAFFLMSGYTHYTEKELNDLGMTKLFEKPIDSEAVIHFINSELLKK